MSEKKLNRRDIIKASALSLAGFSLSSFSAVSVLNEKRESIPLRYKDKVAFITGAARGIGLSIAEELAKEGANIVIFDIAKNIDSVPYELSSTEDLLAAKIKVESNNVRCLAIQGDVRSSAELEKAIARTVQEFGRLDFLVANAGVTRFGSMQNHNEKMIQDIMDINLGGVIKTIKAAIPILSKQKFGRVITLSSVVGRGGAGNFSVYAASKWGVIGFTKSVAYELGPSNVTCNAICPTGIDTKLAINDHMLMAWGGEDAGGRSGLDNFLKGTHALPIGILPPEEIAKTTSFLCSDAATYITGTVLDVSAGWTAKNNA